MTESTKYANSDDAYRRARRSILNNALRRRQNSLDLSGYGLLHLPPEIGQLTFLSELWLSGNKLRELPAEIGKCAALTSLNLRSNELSALPDEVRHLSNLRSLSLDNNFFKEMPSPIEDLHQLGWLTISRNNIASIPVGLFTKLTQLRHIILDDNEFSEFPGEILACHALISLYLAGNNISSIPEYITRLTQLRHLILSANSFNELPNSLLSLPLLQTLVMDSNQIRALPQNIAALTNLSKLSLRDNALNDLPLSLGDMKTLERMGGLFLSGNPLPDPFPIIAELKQPLATKQALAWLRSEWEPAPAPVQSESVEPREPHQEGGPSFELVGEHFDLSRQEQGDFDHAVQNLLHDRLLERTETLLREAGKISNQHPDLCRVLDDYIGVISPPLQSLNVPQLWAVGTALMATAQACAEQQRQSGLFTEPLEPPVLSLLTECARLHGGFVLGFPKGLELTERADRAQLSPDVSRAIEAPTVGFLQACVSARALLAERARTLASALEATLIGGSWEIARVGHSAYVTVRNLLIALGKCILWTNDKGGSVLGSIVTGSIMLTLPPDTMVLASQFLITNAAQIIAFAAPFPELRDWMQWILDSLDRSDT